MLTNVNMEIDRTRWRGPIISCVMRGATMSSRPNESINHLRWSFVANLVLCCALLLCGCKRETSSPRTLLSVGDDAGRRSIEGLLGTKLPESASNCRYQSKGMWGTGIGWGYFEISRVEFLQLLNTSERLPSASELGQVETAQVFAKASALSPLLILAIISSFVISGVISTERYSRSSTAVPLKNILIFVSPSIPA